MSSAEAAPAAAATSGAFAKGVIFNSVCLVLITGVAWGTGAWLSAGVSVGVNWLVFLVHALPQSSEKFFDATGTLTYVTLTITAFFFSPQFQGLQFDTRQYVLGAMVLIWSIRLGSYLLGRICRDGKDARFDSLKVSFILWLGVWSMQALWCYLVALPALIIIGKPPCVGTAMGPSPSVLDIVGWLVWLFAFGFEVIADRQKDAFRQDPANKGKFINIGLWAYSRHPNYFGEILMWMGICVSGMSCFRGFDLLAWMSPVTTFVLLNYVSGVPLLEKVGQERWGDDPAYIHYLENTPCVFPRLTAPPPYKAVEVPLAKAGLGA